MRVLGFPRIHAHIGQLLTTGNVSAEEVGIDAAWESGPILAVLADKAEPFVISMIHSIISSTISDAQVT